MNTNSVDVMIYIHSHKDKLVLESGITTKIEQLAGVIKASVSPIVKQLVVVKYDPDSISAQSVLRAVKSNGYSGALVGM